MDILNNGSKGGIFRESLNANFQEAANNISDVRGLVSGLTQTVSDLNTQINVLQRAIQQIVSGPGCNFKPWTIHTNYTVGIGVQNSGNFYICKQEHLSGDVFNEGWWYKL